jgi:hypothetical protein
MVTYRIMGSTVRMAGLAAAAAVVAAAQPTTVRFLRLVLTTTEAAVEEAELVALEARPAPVEARAVARLQYTFGTPVRF